MRYVANLGGNDSAACPRGRKTEPMAGKRPRHPINALGNPRTRRHPGGPRQRANYADRISALYRGWVGGGGGGVCVWGGPGRGWSIVIVKETTQRMGTGRWRASLTRIRPPSGVLDIWHLRG